MFFIAYPTKKIWRLIAVIGVVIVVGWLGYYHFVIVPNHTMTLTNTVTEAASKSFRDDRILAWLYPDDYPQASMQSRYSMYAIGFGGILGRGLGRGTMKYYLPFSTNDFIFGVIGEELGLVGCGLDCFPFCLSGVAYLYCGAACQGQIGQLYGIWCRYSCGAAGNPEYWRCHRRAAEYRYQFALYQLRWYSPSSTVV